MNKRFRTIQTLLSLSAAFALGVAAGRYTQARAFEAATLDSPVVKVRQSKNPNVPPLPAVPQESR